MNILFWILQALLAFHTATGAVWKFSNSEQAVPSLSAIPHGAWLGLIGVELLCSLGLILPALYRPWAIGVPVAGALIAAEMLLFSGIHLASGDKNHGQTIYWLVVAALCGLLVYGRLVLKPL